MRYIQCPSLHPSIHLSIQTPKMGWKQNKNFEFWKISIFWHGKLSEPNGVRTLWPVIARLCGHSIITCICWGVSDEDREEKQAENHKKTVRGGLNMSHLKYKVNMCFCGYFFKLNCKMPTFCCCSQIWAVNRTLFSL